MDDRLDRGAEEVVATRVIVVGVGVDDRGDRLVGHRLDSIEDGLAPSGELRVDQHDTFVGDEHGGVAAAELVHNGDARAGDDIQVVFHLLDRGDFQRCCCRPLRHRLARRDDDRECAEGDNGGEDGGSSVHSIHRHTTVIHRRPGSSSLLFKVEPAPPLSRPSARSRE